MSNFEFAKMPKEYDYFSSPAVEKPRKSLSMYEALSSSAAVGDDHSSFEFATCAPRDFFGHLIEKTAMAEPKVTEPIEFAPCSRKTDYFGDPEGPSRHEVNTFSKGHDDDDCDCAGECHDCNAQIQKMTFRKGQKLRHLRTGKIFEMVKTLCTTAKECYCVLKENGRECQCLFYLGEVEAA